MNFKFLTAATALALGCLSTPAMAQHEHMPGMNMPTPKTPSEENKAAPKKAAPKKPAPKEPAKKAPHKAVPLENPSAPVAMGHSQMSHDSMDQPTAPVPAEPPMDHSRMDHSKMQHGAAGGHAGHGAMSAAFGSYPLQRESSGTAWQPDTSDHMGWMAQTGDWSLMAHGVLNFVVDHQSGPRGDDKAFPSGMLMGMAQRPIGNGTLQFKAMLSPDPIMGKSGYPLLLASGETANGTDRLIDRQHPHDFFMELSGSVSQNIGPKSSAFLYAGLPGEPAFGPPAFMHREAILDSPEAPISHHWLDSTHITFGVVTAGLVIDRVKLEVSRFNAREPDQHRWNIETGPLDSMSARISWNPTPELALQGSWGHFEDPEQLEPGVDQKRWSASALYAWEFAPGWKLAGTLAWGRKAAEGHKDDAFVAEASVKHADWTIFGRGEFTENRELIDLVEHGPAYRVGKVSVGAVRDFRIAEHFTVGAGGLFAVNFMPDSLAPLYGGNNPIGAMGFLRLKLD